MRARYLDYLERDVKQRLAGSIHSARFLDIGVNEKINATVPWHYKVLEGEQQFSNFDLAFKHFNGRVLLLGPPGSGKTTTLLNLALQLITEAQQNEAADIPLLFNLSKFGSVSPGRVAEQLKWLHKRKDAAEENPTRVFEQWLVQMLVEMPVEGLNRHVAQEWVTSGNIAPLLDGLDELDDIYLLKLAKILNQTYFREHPDQTVVVCSRLIDYQQVQDNKEARLRLDGAVVLQPPTPEQIDSYLETAQALALRDALRGDNALYEMAQTPLTLSMMTLAYGGEAPTDIPPELPFIERRRLLLDTYVERMVQRTARREINIPFDLNPDNDVVPEYSLKQINHYLGWLAIKLSERSRTLFPLDRFYNFLSKDYPQGDFQSIAVRFGPALVAIWLVAVLTNAGLLLPQGWDPVWGLAVIPLLAPLIVLGAAVWQIPKFGDGCLGLLMILVTIVVVVGYSGLTLILINQSVVSILNDKIGPAVVITMLVAFAAIVVNLFESITRRRRNYRQYLILGVLWFWGMAIGVAIPAPYRTAYQCSLVIVVVTASFIRIGERKRPSLRSWKSLLGTGLVWIVLITVVVTLGEIVESRFLLALSVIITISLGIFVVIEESRGIPLAVAGIVVLANWFGGPAVAMLAVVGMILLHLIGGRAEASRFMEWLILNPFLKISLIATNNICFRYKAFLQYATNTMLLKEVGSEYEFVHRLVRDHFAVRELLPELYQARGEERFKIIQRLSRQGDSSLDALASLMTNSEPQIRAAAIEGLGQIATPKVALVMNEVLRTEPDEIVRISVIKNLRKLPKTEQFEIFRVGMYDLSPLVRQAVIMNAVNFDGIQLQGLTDESEMVFRQTLIQLFPQSFFHFPAESNSDDLSNNKTGTSIDVEGHDWPRQVLTSDLLDRLANALLDEDEKVSRGATNALRSFYSSLAAKSEWVAPQLSLDSIVPALITSYGARDWDKRKAVISTLSAIAGEPMSANHHEQIQNVLINASRDTNNEVRDEAILGLGKVTSPATLRTLRELLNHKELYAREVVIRQLGKGRDREAVPAIMNHLNDPNLHFEVATALAEIGDYSVVPKLLSCLEDPNQQISAIMALAELKETSAIPKIRELMMQLPERKIGLRRFTKQPFDIRPVATVAIGKLADLESVPLLAQFPPSLPTQILVSRALALRFILPADAIRIIVEALENMPRKQQEALYRKFQKILRSPKAANSPGSLTKQLARMLLLMEVVDAEFRDINIWRFVTHHKGNEPRDYTDFTDQEKEF